MKKKIILLLTLLILTGCSKVTKFEEVNNNQNKFHEIEVAEKINGKILYLDGKKLKYDNKVIDDNISNIWRENKYIYYVNNDILYKYNLDNNYKKEICYKPYKILGKYKDNIISYTGRSIFSINDNGKKKIFKNGYYVNKAILYKNKVYGIPTKNIYEYNLDSLKIKKINTGKHDYADFNIYNNNLYIINEIYNKNRTSNKFIYYKLENNKFIKQFEINNISMINDSLYVKDRMFVSTQKNDKDITKGNELLYINNNKIKRIDKNYAYELIGIIDNKLLYYKNNTVYGDGKNLKSFYMFDGKRKRKAFDLDISYYEGLYGHSYKDGIIIEVAYEMGENLYKYDGKRIRNIKLPSNIYSINNLNIIDNKLYIRYSDGEESNNIYSDIINLNK